MKLFGYEIKRTGPSSRKLILPNTFMGIEYATPENYQSLIKAYRSWVYICANKNSNTVAQQQLRLYVAKPSKTTKLHAPTKAVSRKQLNYLDSLSSISNLKSVRLSQQVEEVLDHPFLDLMKNVNNFTNSFDLWDTTMLGQELTGNSYWYVVMDSLLGIPEQLWIVPSADMKVIPDRTNFIKGYVYTQGATSIRFEINEIVHHKFSSPQDLYYGKSPLSAVTQAYNINENIALYDNALFSNMGRPEGALVTDQKLNDTEFERLQKQWKAAYGGVSKAGKTAVLEKGVKYEKYTMTPRELNHIEGRKAVQEEICNAYGQSLGMYSEKSNRANSEQANLAFLRDTIQPRLRRLEEKINEQLMPLYDDNIFVAFDSPVPEDKVFRLKERESNLRTGYSSINQERLTDNQEEVEWGSVPILQQSMIPLGSAPVSGDVNGQPIQNDENDKFIVRQILASLKRRAQ